MEFIYYHKKEELLNQFTDEELISYLNSKNALQESNVNVNSDLDDNDPLPYAVDKMIQLVTDLQLITKLERTYH